MHENPNLGSPQAKQGLNPGLGKDKLRAWWHSVNPDTVSKIVDENGETMVVYHGTDKNAVEFDECLSADGGFWFTSDKSKVVNGE